MDTMNNARKGLNTEINISMITSVTALPISSGTLVSGEKNETAFNGEIAICAAIAFALKEK